MLSWLGLLALAIVLVPSVATPVRRTALILTAAIASTQALAAPHAARAGMQPAAH